ncbi:hypothetical protein BaRGS_00008233 [Batillaria attramentaria]|uniref:Peptidase S1 domain-containing protein n=1 Tax=Batillaria attramentaria TaxID=370345 RepID=A0ABD0LNT3_9CAEN
MVRRNYFGQADRADGCSLPAGTRRTPLTHRPDRTHHRASWTHRQLHTVPVGRITSYISSRLDASPVTYRPVWTHHQLHTVPAGRITSYTQSQLDASPVTHTPSRTRYQLHTVPASHITSYTPSRLDESPVTHRPSRTHHQLHTVPARRINSYTQSQLDASPVTRRPATESINLSIESPTLTSYTPSVLDASPVVHYPSLTHHQLHTVPAGRITSYTQSRLDALPVVHYPSMTHHQLHTVPAGRITSYTQSRLDASPVVHYPSMTHHQLHTVPTRRITSNTPFDEFTFRVTAGVYNKSEDGRFEQSREIAERRIHPDYNGTTVNNDIAILKLASRLKLKRGVVEKVRWNHKNKCPQDGDIWGITPELPMKVDVPIVNSDECSLAYEEEFGPDSIGPEKLCAGAAEGGKDSCQGDSGGPFMCTCNGVLKQVGIVSYGIGCARTNYPGVYARVSYFTRWIKNNRR